LTARAVLVEGGFSFADAQWRRLFDRRDSAAIDGR
jgi:hypothetical protein